MAVHPLTALSEAEILLAAQLIRASYEPGTGFRFKGISLFEPSKKEMQRFRGQNGAPGTVPARKAWVNYYLAGTGFFHEAIVNLDSHELERRLKVPTGFHGSCDDAEILLAEKITLADPRVQEEIEKLQLPPG